MTKIILPVLHLNHDNQDKLEISDDARNALKDAQKVDPAQVDQSQTHLQPNEKLKVDVFSTTLKAIGDFQMRQAIFIPARPLVVQTECREVYMESEKMSFKAQGKIKTADGKEIDFSSELNMSREFVTDHITNINQRLLDPLVVNFDGPAAALTDTKFSFDLDNDGTSDQISSLNLGSGFLALDQNQDGVINNGSELFGTKSGNGFADLARYDLDQNGWIDENDAIFDKLRIWTKDQSGRDVLFGLGQKGIGAIYLGSVGTQFSLKNEANQTQGEIRSSGVFLREDGTTGTMQQIDLAI